MAEKKIKFDEARELSIQALLDAENARSSSLDTVIDEDLQLRSLCRELTGYLNEVEISDNGTEFYPTTIQSCRCMTLERIGEILSEIKSICNEN